MKDRQVSLKKVVAVFAAVAVIGGTFYAGMAFENHRIRSGIEEAFSDFGDEDMGEESATDESSEGEATENVQYDESAIVEHLNLKDDGTDTESYIFTEGAAECPVSVILTDPSMVSLYADAGDNVATNPDASAGVKIVADEGSTCKKLITAALEDLPDPE